MSRYLVTLKPIDKFFFGGDMTFEIDGNDKHNKSFKSYIIESSRFPQQTSLLGMMRFLLLRKSVYFSDNKIIDKDKAAKLIGEHSFQVKNSDEFGKIKSLSGCFIRDRYNHLDYAFAPFTQDFSICDTDRLGSINGIEMHLPDIVGFTAKSGYTKYLLSIIEGKRQMDEVFVADRRIGINRNISTGLTDENALYKQVSYRFKDFDKDDGVRVADYCFAFYVEVEDVNLMTSEYNGEVVSVGADNSQFIINFEKDGTDNRPCTAGNNSIVLQSPSYLTRDALKHSSFFVTETIPFRFLETTVCKTDNYTVHSKTLKRSHKYELYAPGSVFFFESDDKMKDFIANLTNVVDNKEINEFARIGFNEFSKK